MAATDVDTVKRNSRLRLVQATELGYLGISFNIANGDKAKTPLGQDARVRRAIELAIDRDAINRWSSTACSRPATSGCRRKARGT